MRRNGEDDTEEKDTYYQLLRMIMNMIMLTVEKMNPLQIMKFVKLNLIPFLCLIFFLNLVEFITTY
jgi:hypothetical protein